MYFFLQGSLLLFTALLSYFACPMEPGQGKAPLVMENHQLPMNHQVQMRHQVQMSHQLQMGHQVMNHPIRNTYHLRGQAQGTSFSIHYISSKILDSIYIYKIFKEIDESLSLYNPASLISRFNRSTVGIKADRHLLYLVNTSLTLNALSDGCFDITSRPLSLLWGMNASRVPKRIPGQNKLNRALKFVGSDKVFIRNDSLLKTVKNVQIDLDGIAQGYTVDLLAGFFRKNSIDNFMIELGGEVCAQGVKLGGEPWILTFSECLETIDNKIIEDCNLKLFNRSVTTSGSLSKYKKIGHRYFSHILDPRTGYPVNNRILSVSVFAPNTTLADGLDNALMVMGLEKALAFMKGMPDLDAYFTYVDQAGVVRDTATFSTSSRYNSR